MFNLVPELASADSQVFWSHGCFTNMLDYGAEHLTLRQLDMPANFFASNNCVAESGQFPTNFLLGVSTPGNDIRVPASDAVAARRAHHGGGKPAGEIRERGLRGGERKRRPCRAFRSSWRVSC